MKLNEIYMRDPYMYVEDNICYLIGTTDKQAWGGKASGFLGYKSNDMINFEGPFELFKSNDNFWADENYWAPELHKIDGKYYIFASFYKNGKHRASQALVSSTPIGKYVPTNKPFTPSEWECLDATYWEENGKKYSIFSHEWTQIIDGEICVGELDNDFTELNNVKVLFKASDAKWVVPHMPDGKTKNYITDGPFIYKTKSERLLMLWSSLSNEGYALAVAYSDSGIMGEWKQCDEPMFQKDGGHGMIFNYKGKNYLILHTNNCQHLMERPYIQEVVEKDNFLYIKK